MNWPTEALGRLARPVGGGTPSKQNDSFWNGTIPWVSPKDMGHREIRDAEDHITDAAVASSATQLVPAGSVLVVVRSGILVRRFPVAIARVPVALNQDMKAFLPGGPLGPDFLAYALEERADHVLSSCVKRGATVHSVDVEKLQRIQIPVPAPAEQRRIVDLLDQADTLRRQRAETDAKADRIIPSLFVKLFGDPATNPKGWPRSTLGQVEIDLRYGTSQRCDDDATGIPVLRIPNVVRGEVDRSDMKFSRFDGAELARLRLQADDLLFVRTNGNPDYVGRCAVYQPLSVGDTVFASYLIRARLETTQADPWYVAAFLRTTAGRLAMKPYIRTTAGQSNIGADGLRSLPLLLPPAGLQLRFRANVMAARKDSASRCAAARQLDVVFSTLLRRAFSGTLTFSWREAHMKELLQEMEVQARHLAAASFPEARA